MEEKEKNVIEIRPVTKWKRFLAFLADYFIAFIISFTLFNLAIFPLAKIAFNTQSKSEHATALENQAIGLLIEDGYLYSAREGSNFEDNVNYTFKVFLSYYAFDEETPDSAHSQYGHKLENEVVYHYYQNVIKDDDKYIADLYKSFMSNPQMNPQAPIMPDIDASMFGSGIVRASMPGTMQMQGGMMVDTSYLNYQSNLSPEQNSWMYENDPSVQQVLVFDDATGNKFFQYMNVTTGQVIPNMPVYGETILEDTTIDRDHRIAKNMNINQTFPLVIINENTVASQY